jgi:PAS domain S-box-containing protein
MAPTGASPEEEIEELRLRLEEAEQTLRAIRSGEVDSLVVEGPNGPRVYALEGVNSSYRVLVEAMNEGAATLTKAGTILYCNHRFAGLLGLPLEKVMGGAMRDHVSSDQRDTFDALLERGWEEPSKGEIALQRRDGTLVRLHLSLSALVDEEPVLCLVATDLTEHFRALELHERERRAVSRAAELEEADRRKDEFLGMLSHELRNPLAPIRNSAYILERADPMGEQASRARSVIQRQTEHLTRIVDDLLDVTRIARGKIELRRRRVDLREVVKRVAEDFRLGLEDRGITFRTAFPEVKLWADADATRITQVVGNLLHNSSKFTARGGEVTLSVREAGGEAEISVRDTGTGIDPALRLHVFEAFVQGERTLARTEGGLGLGLALVKGITELHGGTVRAESAGKGKGAEFVVRLPLGGPIAVQETQRGGSAPPSKGRRVLVVDDNADAAESLAEIVSMLGYAVEIAYDGPTALEMARASTPDVVLCDIGLPGMNGYEVARALRASGANGMQLIAVSGYALPEDVTRAVEAGFDGHLAKPCDPAQIERLLG